jgi:hypothetical protein
MRTTFALALFAVIALAGIQQFRSGRAATDTAPPRITKAAMQDDDRDGRADGVLLTYSEKVMYDGSTGGGPFTVVGYRIRGVVHAHAMTTVSILIAEKPGPDRNARPAVSYSPFACKGPGVVDLRGNEAVAQTFTRTRSLGGRSAEGSIAAAAPRIIAALMKDTDDDGRADRLVLSYSRPVSYPGEPRGGGPFTVDGYRVLRVPAVRNSSVLALVLQEKGAPDGRAKPDTGYCAPSPGSNTASEQPVRSSGPAGTKAPTQVFNDTLSTNDVEKHPTVTVKTVGRLQLGRPGALQCSGAFLEVGGVRQAGELRATGLRSCEATFTEVPFGASASVSILGAVVPQNAVGGCDEVEIQGVPKGGVIKTGELVLTAAGFADCVI